jgi:hypothetical protein
LLLAFRFSFSQLKFMPQSKNSTQNRCKSFF